MRRTGTGPSSKTTTNVPQAPRTRGDCSSMPRPCPFTSCRYHLLPEARLTLAELKESCALDVADRGSLNPENREKNDGATLEEVGELLCVTRERVRQIEAKALSKIRKKLRVFGVDLEQPPEQPNNDPWASWGF